MDFEKEIQDGIREGIKSRLSRDYQNPIDALIRDAIGQHGESIKALIGDSIKTCVADPAFREEVAVSVRTVLAKQLVQKFGGELEKQVNALKSDPATRARITLALEEIVAAKVS